MQDQLLLWLDPDLNLAGKRLEKIRNMLFDKFNSRWYLSNEDVEDLVQETLVRVAQNLEKRKEVHDKVPEDYINSVANNVLKEAVDYKKKKSQRQRPFNEEEQIIDQDGNLEEHILTEIEQERHLECLNKCLMRLKPDERKLIELYSSSTSHWTGKLLNVFGGTSGKLRTKMHRLMRFKLKPCIEKCLNNQPVD